MASSTNTLETQKTVLRRQFEHKHGLNQTNHFLNPSCLAILLVCHQSIKNGRRTPNGAKPTTVLSKMLLLQAATHRTTARITPERPLPHPAWKSTREQKCLRTGGHHKAYVPLCLQNRAGETPPAARFMQLRAGQEDPWIQPSILHAAASGESCEWGDLIHFPYMCGFFFSFSPFGSLSYGLCTTALWYLHQPLESSGSEAWRFGGSAVLIGWMALLTTLNFC